MKKINKLTVLLLVIVLFSMSCGKDKDNTYEKIPDVYKSIEIEIIN